jgi:hypothetical protein
MYDTTGGGPSTQYPDIILEAKTKKLLLGAKYVYNDSKASIQYRVPFSADPFTSTCAGFVRPSYLCIVCSSRYKHILLRISTACSFI